MEVYKQYAAPWVLEEAGVREVWQQAQERKHRTLKSLRSKLCNRTAVDLIEEIHALVSNEQQQELDALVGRGPFKLAPSFLKFQVCNSNEQQAVDGTHFKVQMFAFFRRMPMSLAILVIVSGLTMFNGF